MINRLEQSPFEQKFKLGPEEAEPGASGQELFEETTQTLQREAPAIAEELEEMSGEEKAALDQALNMEGLSWSALRGVDMENQTRVQELLKEWKEASDPDKKKEAAKKLIGSLN